MSSSLLSSSSSLYLVIAAALCLAALAGASPSGIFSAADSAAALDAAAAAVNADGSYGSGIHDTAAVVEAFAHAKHAHKSAKATCAFAAGLVGSSSVREAADAAFVLAELSCSEAAKATAAADKLAAAAASANMADIFAAARALVAMGKDASAAVPAAIALMDEDGTFKETSDSEFGSVQGAALALQTIARVAKKGSDLKAVTDALADVVALAEGPESGDYLAMFSLNDAAADPLVATGYILDAAVRLERLTDSAPAYTAETLGLFAQYLVVRKRSASPAALAALLKGIDAVGSNAHFQPTVVALTQGTVAKAQPLVRVRVSDIRGNAVAAKVVASRVVREGAAKPLLTATELSAVAGSAGDYELNFGSHKPEAGFYVFDVAATPSGGKAAAVSSVHLHVKVITEIALSDCDLAIVQELVGTIDTKPVPCKAGALVAGQVSVDQAQRIRFSFKIVSAETRAAMSPHQVFALFTNEATGLVASFVVPKTAAGYALDLALASAADEFGAHSGKWRFTVVIGDAFIANPQVWEVAEFNVKFSSPAAKATGDVFAHKPDIKHIFRQPEKRSAEVVSLAFTGIVLAPVALLVVLLGKVGANISNLPSGTGALYAVGFHGAVAAILALFAVFWLRLNMFETLTWLAVFGVAAIGFGHKLLTSHVALRSESRTSK